MRLIHERLENIRIRQTYDLEDFLGVLSLIEIGEDVAEAQCGEAVRLVVGQNLQILIVSFDQKAILLPVGIIFHIDGVLERNVGQSEEAVGIISNNLLDYKLKFITRFADETVVQKEFTFEAMLVNWCLKLRFTSLINPIDTPVEIAALPGEISQSEVGVDVVWLFGDDLFIFAVAVIVLMLNLMPVS